MISYKESEIVDEKHIINNPVIVDLTTKFSMLKIHVEEPVYQKYYSYDEIFHLKLDDETETRRYEAHTNHLFQVKRKIGYIISEDEPLRKKHKNNKTYYNKYASITTVPRTKLIISKQSEMPTPIVSSRVITFSAFMDQLTYTLKEEWNNEYKIHARQSRR
uniref:Uncharacterized protein n=1 Tax=Schizaphis graminum TaxID=13262 RepID=A0A2S2PIR1_SCHGA